MNILDLEMKPNDAKATTIRDYLKTLLKKVWKEEESFSGKRPFGDSGWKYDIYDTLALKGVIKATVDEDGYVEFMPAESKDLADKLIDEAIDTL